VSLGRVGSLAGGTEGTKRGPQGRIWAVIHLLVGLISRHVDWCSFVKKIGGGEGGGKKSLNQGGPNGTR